MAITNKDKNIFYLFFVISSLVLSLHAQSDNYQLFDSIVNSLVQNFIPLGSKPISTISLNTSCKSYCPCSYLNPNIINLSNKPITTTWIDGNGNPSYVYPSSLDLGPINIYAIQNYCYKLTLDANDPNSTSIYIQFPMNNGSYYIGDFSILRQTIYNSSWINNSNLTIQHLQQVKNLVTYNKQPLTQSGFKLFRSSYYDDTNETQQLIRSFFNSFNSTNKFIDPLFNPLNNLSGYLAQRVSDLVIRIPVNYNVSTNLGGYLSFNLANDASTDYDLYWIGFRGDLNPLGTLSKGKSMKIDGFLGKAFALDNNQTTYLIQIGYPPFVNSNANVYVSMITNLLDYSISNPYVKPVIIDKNMKFDNSAQHMIGDCYILATFISIYQFYPNAIMEKFIFPELMNQTGAVAVKLWDKLNQQWRLIMMDDYLDTGSYSWLESGPAGEFKNVFWSPFLEKAIAKQVSGFSYLTAGQNYLNINVIHEFIFGPLLNNTFWVILNLDDTNFSQFNDMAQQFKNGGVFTFGSRMYPGDGFFSNVTCLAMRHAYGLIDLRLNVANSGLSFIRVQNPWQFGGESCGDWSDSSPLWDQYPEIKKELNFVSKDDGAFWFEKKDLVRLFSTYWGATVNKQ